MGPPLLLFYKKLFALYKYFLYSYPGFEKAFLKNRFQETFFADNYCCFETLKEGIRDFAYPSVN